MTFQTKAFDAQDALLGLLKASPSLSAWSIDYGLPAGRPTEQAIWVDEKVDEWDQEGATTGLVTRQEAFHLSVYLYSRKTGATAAEVRNELKTAAGVVADIVGSAPFLGGVVMFAEIRNPEYEGAFADPEGRAREGVLRLKVGCTGFITGA